MTEDRSSINSNRRMLAFWRTAASPPHSEVRLCLALPYRHAAPFEFRRLRLQRAVARRVDLTSQRAALITLFNSGGRGAVMYRLADDNVQTNPVNNRTFIDAEYNRAFVATQYFGYLRRDSDIGGFLFWLGQVSSAPLRDVTRQHAMVCSFITSAEYQLRFSSLVPHTNGECQ